MRFLGEHLRTGVLENPISAITSVGTSILGGFLGSSAAKKASNIQYQSTLDAAQGVKDATADANTGITNAATKASTDATTTASTAGKADVDIAKAEGDKTIQAGKEAGAGVTTAALGANKLLDPYAQAGATAADVLNKGIAPGGDFNKTPTLQDLQMDPGYAFRVQQQQIAMERSAAAHGGVGGGGFQKDLVDYSQGAASQEYKNAFDRFETSTQNRFANVSGVAGQGQVAATRQGGNLIDAGKYVGDTGIATTEHAGDNNIQATVHAGDRNTQATEFGGGLTYDASKTVGVNKINMSRSVGDYLTQGANARASGILGSANAWSNALGGVASGVNSAFMLNKINPTPGLAKGSMTPGGSFGGYGIGG